MSRSITSSDLDLALSCAPVDATGFVDSQRYQRDLATGSYRPEWTWILEYDGTLLARALWWAPPGYDHPAALDCLWVSSSVADPVTTATRLLSDGHTVLRSAGMPRLPEYNLDVPTKWREERATREAVAWRCHAAAQAGLDDPVERLGLRWTSATPLPPRSTRLTFDPASDEAFLEAFRGVAQGSLDLLTHRNLAAMGPYAQARDDMDFYLGLPGRRDRWQLAHDHDGTPVGVIIPSRSAESASVSYLGVLPQARGHRYVDDLLAEITHLHAEDGAVRITANTDTTNHPMAAAFHRAGYQITKIRLVMSPPTRLSPPCRRPQADPQPGSAATQAGRQRSRRRRRTR